MNPILAESEFTSQLQIVVLGRLMVSAKVAKNQVPGTEGLSEVMRIRHKLQGLL